MVMMSDADYGSLSLANSQMAAILAKYVPQPTPPGTPAVVPTGKGMFIWNLPADPNAAADQLHAAGIQWAAVKIHDGPLSLATAPALPKLIGALRRAGIAVWGWGYCYLASPVAEADIAGTLCTRLDLAGYLIDAEGEAAATGGWLLPHIFAAALRQTLPTQPIGLCSYRYPTLHADLPWAELLSVCTFHAPQVYWLGDNTADGPCVQLTRSVRELKALRDLPVVPVGVAAVVPGWAPSTTQITNFITCANSLALPGYAWWVFEQAVQHADWWAAIAGTP